jgi:hypothetical protein
VGLNYSTNVSKSFINGNWHFNKNTNRIKTIPNSNVLMNLTWAWVIWVAMKMKLNDQTHLICKASKL